MYDSWPRRFLLFALVILLTLTVFTYALAAKPDFFTFQGVFVYEYECDGFNVIHNEDVWAKFSFHTDKNGNLVMIIGRFNIKHTFNNSVTGKSLFSPDVGIDKFVFHPDGSATQAVIGLITHVILPGEGQVFARHGIIIMDLDTGETIFEAGQWDDWDNLIPTLCSALK
jgi:hypothetical protein